MITRTQPGNSLMDALSAYLPEDRLAELAGGPAVAEAGRGAVLFADVAGFTALTARLAELYGPRRGAEEVPVYLNRLYEALIGEVHAYGGVVVGFAGDAIACWFSADDGRRAVACANAMQAGMAPFARLDLPAAAGAPAGLHLKVAVSSGGVRRFRVGEPGVQLLDMLAGAPVAELEQLNDALQRGQVLLSPATAAALAGVVELAEAPAGPPGARLAGPFLAGRAPRRADRPAAPAGEPAPDAVGSWLLPTVQRRLAAGGGDFLTELRPVAALFLGFTSRGLATDEGAGAKLDAVVRAAQRVVTELGGNVLQLTSGDKDTYLYSAFGAPVAHEDDAARAAAAALDLRAELLASPDVTNFKIGLGYGTARTGAYGSTSRRTYGALGEGTNMAARMMSAAPHGSVYASGPFVSALGDGFEHTRLPDLVVKGSAAPVVAYELRARAAATRRHAAGRPLLGRGEELALLGAALQRAARSEGGAVQVVAEAGMGKSELVKSALGRAAGLRVLAGACQAYGRTAPYQLFKNVVAELLGLAAGGGVEERVAGVRAALAALGEGLAERAGLLAPILDLPLASGPALAALDAEERNAARLTMLRTLFRAAATATALGGETLVLLLEDLHWLDPASAELLGVIGPALADLPALVLTTARPHDSDPLAVPGAIEGAVVLRLGPLAGAAAREVVAARLAGAPGLGSITPELEASMVERSGGNPFYLEELVTDLLQRAQARPGEDLARLAGELPTSLHSLILGRLDRLAHGQLVSLKVASVVGRQFRVAWVSACQEEDEESVAAALAGTDQVGLTQLVERAPLTHAFNHAITRDVTYDSQPHAGRTRLHTRLARFIEERLATAAEPHLDLLAYHYALGDDPAKARHYLAAAGAAAKAAYANQAALDYYGRLLALQVGEERLPTLLELGEIMTFVGAYAAAEERLAEALELAAGAEPASADATRADAARATALRLLGELRERQGDHGGARTSLEAAAALCRRLGAGAELTRVLLALGGNVLWHLGEYDEAARLLAEAVDLARAAYDNRAAARALHGVANVHLYRGEAAAAERAFSESLAMRRAAHDEYGVAQALNNLAIVAANAGSGARAEELFGESLAIRQRLGDVAGMAVALNNLGYMAAERADLAAARGLYEESLALRRQLGDRLGLAVSLNNLAGLELRLGAVAAARGHYLESLRLASSIDNGREAAAALAGLAGATPDAAAAARMALVAEALLARLGAAVDEDVRLAIEAGKARSEGVLAPAELARATVSEAVRLALGE